MSKPTILIVLGDHTWTVQAMHLACAVARDMQAAVTVVKLVPVNHPLNLGQSSQLVNYTNQDRLALLESAATAEDYGVEFSLQVCSISRYVSGLASIVEQLGAAIVLAPPSTSRFAWWSRWQAWRIRHAVSCPVYSQFSFDGQLLMARDVAANLADRRDDSASPQVSAV